MKKKCRKCKLPIRGGYIKKKILETFGRGKRHRAIYGRGKKRGGFLPLLGLLGPILKMMT